VWASVAAYACMSAGGYLGGHLVYRRRAAVDHADRSPEPREFVAVLPLAELKEKVPHRAAVWDEVGRKEIGIALVRQGDRVHAMGARCSHAGGPLDQGWVLDGALVCPWHGSRYDLETGEPLSGPSTCPQPRYLVRVRDGMVEVKREQEPGDPAVTSDTLKGLSDGGNPASETGPAPTATEVLTEHHELLRRLFERVLSTPSADPQRHALLHTLAAELDIHEAVEDAIFYPVAASVTEDVDIAYAEHGVLADMVAATLKLPMDAPAFEENLRALQAAFLHHAGSEERSMFPQAERLPEERLRELGRQLEERLDSERTSRFRRSFRALKIKVMENV
jgi:nitrite reductase/ring-hydroxylating ferredoxin subunit